MPFCATHRRLRVNVLCVDLYAGQVRGIKCSWHRDLPHACGSTPTRRCFSAASSRFGLRRRRACLANPRGFGRLRTRVWASLATSSGDQTFEPSERPCSSRQPPAIVNTLWVRARIGGDQTQQAARLLRCDSPATATCRGVASLPTQDHAVSFDFGVTRSVVSWLRRGARNRGGPTRGASRRMSQSR